MSDEKRYHLSARGLQDLLVRDLTELFQNAYFKTPFFLKPDEVPEWMKEREDVMRDINLHRMAAPTVFRQYLPIRSTHSPAPPSEDGEDEGWQDEDPFPYLVVKLDGGGVESATSMNTVDVVVLVGIFDDNPKNEGHIAVMQIIERIMFHFAERPVLGPFSYADRFDWELLERDGFPYYYGACAFSFYIPSPQNILWEELS